MAKRGPRADSVSNIFVETTRAQAAFGRLDDLLEQGWEETFCRSVLLLGLSRCGKTHILKEWIRRMREAEPDFRAVFSEVPSPCTLRKMQSQLLHDLGDPDPSHGDPVDRDRRIGLLLDGADVLVFDEVQRLVNLETGNVMKDAAAWVTNLQNKCICPIVLSGESHSVMVFQGVVYAEGRMLGQIDVEPYDWRTESIEFRVFLQQIESRLGLTGKSGLGAPDSALRLHMYSAGRIGLVANVVSEARALVRKRGGDSITLEDLAKASDRNRIGAARALPNPFRVANPIPGEIVPEKETEIDPPVSTKRGRFKAPK